MVCQITVIKAVSNCPIFLAKPPASALVSMLWRLSVDRSMSIITVVTSSRLEYYDIINVFGSIFSQRTQSIQLFAHFSYLLLYSFRLFPPIWGPCAAAQSAPWLIRPCIDINCGRGLCLQFYADSVLREFYWIPD